MRILVASLVTYLLAVAFVLLVSEGEVSPRQALLGTLGVAMLVAGLIGTVSGLVVMWQWALP